MWVRLLNFEIRIDRENHGTTCITLKRGYSFRYTQADPHAFSAYAFVRGAKT